MAGICATPTFNFLFPKPPGAYRSLPTFIRVMVSRNCSSWWAEDRASSWMSVSFMSFSWSCSWRSWTALSGDMSTFKLKTNTKRFKSFQMCGSILDIVIISSDIALRYRPKNLIVEKSMLVHVMAWCHQAPSHYMNQYWANSEKPQGYVCELKTTVTYNTKLSKWSSEKISCGKSVAEKLTTEIFNFQSHVVFYVSQIYQL